MITIPEAVQDLFKTDSVFKNFHARIYRNNGIIEITNDNVLAESVSFTESVCSQSAFRFGLTEASELKFTAVDIVNVRGCYVDAAIEIEITSLGQSWIDQHQPTGNETFLDPQVCTYKGRSMYRIPYGHFKIDTCPRNHEAMYKREITAYTERMEAVANPMVEQVANMFFFKRPSLTVPVRSLVYTIMNDTGTLEDAGFVSEGSTPTEDTSTYSVNVRKNGDSTVYTLRAQYSRTTYARPSTNATALATIDWGATDTTSHWDEIIAYVESLDIDYSASGYANAEALAKALLSTQGSGVGSSKGLTRDYPLAFYTNYFVPHAGAQYHVSRATDIPAGTRIIPGTIDGNISTAVAKLNSITFSGSVTTETLTVSYPGSPTVSYWSDPVVSPFDTITIDHTLESKEYWYANQVLLPTYGYANAFSPSGMVHGYLELLCCFGAPSRTGGFRIDKLGMHRPYGIMQDQYSELWFDDAEISPIGYAQVKFTAEDGTEQDLMLQIGTGESVYDLRENDVLSHLVFTISDAEAEDGITIEDKLKDFLSETFVSSMPRHMSFWPFDLTKMGLPFLQAGDGILVYLEVGGPSPALITLDSFILRQTISGIQVLSTTVETINGEAIGGNQ